MKVGQANCIPIERIDMWCMDRIVAVATEIAVALIIGEHKNDIRARFYIGHMVLGRESSSVVRKRSRSFSAVGEIVPARVIA